MCGIVGLHLREPALYPRLGELLTGMLCQATERGPDSAGGGVSGDPRWSPPGRATVSLLPGARSADDVRAALPGAEVVAAGQTLVVHAPGEVEHLVGAVRTALPDVLVVG